MPVFHALYARSAREIFHKSIRGSAIRSDQEAFLSHEQNVYTANFKLIVKGGKLAFYQLAQGVNGAIHVKEFSGGRLEDFSSIEMPRTLPVVIRDMDDHGHLVLTAKPTFGNFKETVEHLSLKPGSIVCGTICHRFPQSLGIMLSPNVMTLTDETSSELKEGYCVQAEIIHVDMETHKIRSRLIGPNEKREVIRYSDWIIGKLGPYVDLQKFDEALSVQKAARPNEITPQKPLESLLLN